MSSVFFWFFQNTGIVLDFKFGDSGLHTKFVRPEPFKPQPLDTQEVYLSRDFLKITVKCPRKSNVEAADWFSETVGGDKDKMLGLDTKADHPKKLHFAFSGKLIVNGKEYDLTLGEEGSNWWAASPVMQVVDRKKRTADFGTAYRLEERNHHEFNFKKKQ